MSSDANPIVHEPKPEVKKFPLMQFVGYLLWLGTGGFGGPIALAGHMRQDRADDGDWVRKEDDLEGLGEEPAGECVRARRHCRRWWSFLVARFTICPRF